MATNTKLFVAFVVQQCVHTDEYSEYCLIYHTGGARTLYDIKCVIPISG